MSQHFETWEQAEEETKIGAARVGPFLDLLRCSFEGQRSDRQAALIEMEIIFGVHTQGAA